MILIKIESLSDIFGRRPAPRDSNPVFTVFPKPKFINPGVLLMGGGGYIHIYNRYILGLAAGKKCLERFGGYFRFPLGAGFGPVGILCLGWF